MGSFSLAVVGLGAIVAPGVLLAVSFYGVSIIRRTSISFGPAIDIALFASLSLLINGLYGGFIGWVSLRVYNPCHASLLVEITDISQELLSPSITSGGCPVPSLAGFLYMYMGFLTLLSCFVGAFAMILAETLGLTFAHGVFSATASAARKGGATICSALCNFGGEHSFIIYVGEVKEILLDEKLLVSHLLLKQVRRSLLYVGDTVQATDATDIPDIARNDEIVIPGSTIQNLAFAHIWNTRTYRFYMMLQALFLVLPFLASVFVYRDMAAAGSGAAGHSRAGMLYGEAAATRGLAAVATRPDHDADNRRPASERDKA